MKGGKTAAAEVSTALLQTESAEKQFLATYAYLKKSVSVKLYAKFRIFFMALVCCQTAIYYVYYASGRSKIWTDYGWKNVVPK